MPYLLVETCFAAPEQYDVYQDQDLVGSIRVRHGCMTAKAGCKTVYDCRVDGDARLTLEERSERLAEAVRAIHAYYSGDSDFRIMGEA